MFPPYLSEPLRRLAFVLVLIGTLACGLSCLALERSWIGRVYPGFTVRHDLTVASLIMHPDTRGLASGDRLLAVDGRPVTGSAEVYAAAAARPAGTAHRYRVATRSGVREVTVASQRYTLAEWIRYPLLYWIAGLVHLLMGAIVSLLRPGLPVTRAHLIYSLLSALILFSAFESINVHFPTNTVVFVAFAFYGTAMLHMAWYLPRRSPWLDGRPWLVSANWWVGGLFGLALIPLIFSGSQALALRLASVSSVLGVLALHASAAFAALSRTSTPAERRQGWVLLLGSVLAFLPLGASAATDHLGLYLAPLLIPLSLMVLPAAIAYAILRHRLFDVDLHIRRFLSYTLLTTALAALYVGAAALLGDRISVPREWEQALLTALVAMALLPLRDAARGLVDRVFFRARYDFQQLTAAFGDQVRQALEAPALITAFAGHVEAALRPGCLAVFVREGAGFALAHGAGLPPEMPERLAPDHPLALMAEGEAPIAACPLAGHEGGWMLPLRSGDELIGFVGVGRRDSGSGYTSTDRLLLVTLASQLAAGYQNARLFTRLVAHARELEQANASLRALDQAKSSFLNITSHELRTPLSSVIGYAEFLEDGLGGELTPAQAEFVAQIHAGGKRLERIVDDLLDFAGLEAGTLRLSWGETALGPLVLESLESLRPQALAAGLTLEAALPGEPVALWADRARLGQVLLNLVGNAIKFTPAGGSVVVAVREAAEGVRVEVRDTGVGLSADQVERVFEKFYQADPGLTREAGGTGLGLSITKSLVTAHGGEIGVESEPGRGSVFWFTLPRHDAAVIPAARAEPAPRAW